jgi:predicted Rossmann-fold nucleotide-binding protein
MPNFPFVLMGKSFWTPLVEYMRRVLVPVATIDAADADRWIVSDSPEEAVAMIKDRAMRDFAQTYGPRAKARWWLGEKRMR